MDWKKALGTIAPMIGTALGGPFGGLAGTVLGSILGVDDPTDDEMLANATKQALADPNKVMQLKEAELAFKAKMKELDIREADLDVENTKSARLMQIKTGSYIPGLLALLVTAGFFGLLGILCWRVIPTDNEEVLYVMVGSLGTAWVAVVNFYFGSSHGSKLKTEIMGKK